MTESEKRSMAAEGPELTTLVVWMEGTTALVDKVFSRVKSATGMLRKANEPRGVRLTVEEQRFYERVAALELEEALRLLRPVASRLERGLMSLRGGCDGR